MRLCQLQPRHALHGLRSEMQDDGAVAEMVGRQMNVEHRLNPSTFEKGFAWSCLIAAALTFAVGWNVSYPSY